MHEVEGRIVLYIAKHISVLTANQFGEPYEKSFPDGTEAAQYKMHPTECSAFLKIVLFPHFRNDLADDIAGSFDSLIIDEPTDISVTKLLALSVIYYSQRITRVVTMFLGLCMIEKCDAARIASAVMSTLFRYNLTIGIMRGLGTEGASVMVGVNTGMYQKLKKVPLILVRRVCHSLSQTPCPGILSTL